jgi:hypothetical protein
MGQEKRHFHPSKAHRQQAHTMLQSKVRGCASQVSTSQGGTAAAARQLLQRARSRCQAVGKQQAEPVQEAAQRLPAQRLLPSLASLAASLALLVQPANAGELSMAFPASANPEIREAQKTLVEAWGTCTKLRQRQQSLC